MAFLKLSPSFIALLVFLQVEIKGKKAFIALTLKEKEI